MTEEMVLKRQTGKWQNIFSEKAIREVRVESDLMISVEEPHCGQNNRLQKAIEQAGNNKNFQAIPMYLSMIKRNSDFIFRKYDNL